MIVGVGVIVGVSVIVGVRVVVGVCVIVGVWVIVTVAVAVDVSVGVGVGDLKMAIALPHAPKKIDAPRSTLVRMIILIRGS